MTVRNSSSDGAARPPVAFDFRRPLTLAREHARVLELALETFSRHWTNQLAMRLRADVTAGPANARLTTYDDYVAGLPALTTMVLFTVEPAQRTAILQFPVSASLLWLDHLLGGPGIPGAVPDRELTEIERTLLLDLLGRTLSDLEYSFASIVALHPHMKAVLFSPQVVQAAEPTSPVITAELPLQVQDTTVTATLMLPAEGILAALREAQENQARGAGGVADTTARARLDRSVQEAPVETHLRLRPVRVRSRDVMQLSIGQLVPLRHPASQPLEVVVGTRVITHAVIGTHGSQLAGLVVNAKEYS